ncbi:MAG: long-chain fatty acid--CoA ligase [Bacteroidales bacterium]|nr:long-chain fatty acid--CoA ligase [Bacteroidales bacterium]MBR5092861.1 long-chain fatty acid--CoA ligase [Bacteroidales bacterium]
MTEITRTFDLLDHLVENFPKDDILAGKVNGEWVKYSSHDYYKYAHYLAYGLCEVGLKEGDRVVTMSANCPEWNFIDMALAMSGIIHVPIYPTLSADNYLHILKHSEANAVFVSTKVLLGRLRPALDKMEQRPQVFTLANIEGERRMLEILKAGIANRDKWMEEIERRKREIKPDDWTTMIYTSGTTGQPKGVMLSHRNLCSNFLAHEKVNPMGSECKVLSFLPLNHVYERSLNYHWQTKGVSIYYAESLGTIQQNMMEIHGDGFCAVPRVLEMVYDKLYAAGKDFTGIRKRIYDWAFRHGQRYDYTLLKKANIFFQMSQWFLDKAVYSKWREKFGGHRLTVITGSSSIQPKMVRLFAAAGINIYEGYGLSETSPVIAVNDPAHHMVKIGTVGPVLSGVEMRFGDDGEILTRGPHVMLGYYKDPEYTAQVIDKDGWFHTGDIGELVSGRYLKITDRKKDIFKLSAGKYVAPQLIENMLRGSEYIDQVMVIGENEKQAAAIISPNFNTLHYWALKYKLHYRDNVELVTLPQVLDKMRKVLDEYNKSLAPHEQIKQFRLVTDEWNATNGLLSPTLKLRRGPLMEKYKDLVADIYGKEKTTSSGLFSAFKSVELPTMPWVKK